MSVRRELLDNHLLDSKQQVQIRGNTGFLDLSGSFRNHIGIYPFEWRPALSPDHLTFWYPVFSGADKPFTLRPALVRVTKKDDGVYQLLDDLPEQVSGSPGFVGNQFFCIVFGNGDVCDIPLKEKHSRTKRSTPGCHGTVNPNATSSVISCDETSSDCKRYCEDRKPCKLTYGSYSGPDEVRCSSDAKCSFDYTGRSGKIHCTEGACAFLGGCYYGCSHDGLYEKSLNSKHADIMIFDCDAYDATKILAWTIVGAVAVMSIMAITFVVTNRLSWKDAAWRREVNVYHQL